MTSTTPTRTVRRAVGGEEQLLAGVQNRSSTHWGYPPGFFDWAPEASVIAGEYVRDNPVYVLEEESRIAGFYGFTIEDGDLLLDKLFIDIDRIGTGCGKALWLHAIAMAREMGATELTFAADPNAAPFYRAMGAEWVREEETSRGGWKLQWFRFPLTGDSEGCRPAGRSASSASGRAHRPG